MTDWGAGSYEHTAARIASAARVAVDALAPERGEEVLDVGCGTGNAALLAAAAGARVTGVDPAARLLEVATERAAADGVRARFVEGGAEALPFGDASFDAAISVFGVIFADAEAAAGELGRVVRPGGRIVLTTWTTEGATPRVMGAFSEAFGREPSTPRWSDPEVVEGLFAPHAVSFARHGIPFTADSPEAYVAEQVEHHPMWIAAAPQLEAAGKLDWLLGRATEILTEENEDPAAFRMTSTYDVVTVRVAS